MTVFKIPNAAQCSVCDFPRRGLIYLRNDADRTPLVPPIAVCPICDWAEGEAGPPIELSRVRDNTNR